MKVFVLSLLLNTLLTALLSSTSNFSHAQNELTQQVAALSTNQYQALKAQLEAIYDKDQALRREVVELEKTLAPEAPELRTAWQKIELQDQANLAEVKRILDQHGWLGPAEVGPRANQTLFMVIQHAEAEDRALYLPLLRQAVQDKKARPADLALMTDRNLHEAGLKQRYGSQLVRPHDQFELVATEDPARLDQRRGAMGLPSIADYLSGFGLKWDLAQYQTKMAEYDSLQKIHEGDFQILADKLWQGQESYRDPISKTLQERALSLQITAPASPGLDWQWHYRYQNHDKQNQSESITVHADGLYLAQQKVIARQRFPNNFIRIVSTEVQTLAGKPVSLRHTYVFGPNSLWIKRERAYAPSEDYQVVQTLKFKPLTP